MVCINYCVVFVCFVIGLVGGSPVTVRHAGSNGQSDSENSVFDDDQSFSKNADQLLKVSLFDSNAPTRESVKLESEAIPSKVLAKYDNKQKQIADLINPKPILDTISEADKFGNNGDMFEGISRALINGYEAFSNLLNKLIGKPQEIARSVSRGLTAQLDKIGAKIVGLA